MWRESSDWSHLATNRNTKDCQQWPEARRETWNRSFPTVFPGSIALLIPKFQISSVQTYEKINFCQFKFMVHRVVLEYEHGIFSCTDWPTAHLLWSKCSNLPISKFYCLSSCYWVIHTHTYTLNTSHLFDLYFMNIFPNLWIILFS